MKREHTFVLLWRLLPYKVKCSTKADRFFFIKTRLFFSFEELLRCAKSAGINRTFFFLIHLCFKCIGNHENEVRVRTCFVFVWNLIGFNLWSTSKGWFWNCKKRLAFHWTLDWDYMHLVFGIWIDTKTEMPQGERKRKALASEMHWKWRKCILAFVESPHT